MNGDDWRTEAELRWEYFHGISTLPIQTPAEKAREVYEAKQRVKRKRAVRLALADQGITDVVVR